VLKNTLKMHGPMNVKDIHLCHFFRIRSDIVQNTGYMQLELHGNKV